MTHEFKDLKPKEVWSFSEILISKHLSYTVTVEKIGRSVRYNVRWSDGDNVNEGLKKEQK